MVHSEAKHQPVNAGDLRDVRLILGGEDPLEEGMATPSSIPACRIPQSEEPGRLQVVPASDTLPGEPAEGHLAEGMGEKNPSRQMHEQTETGPARDTSGAISSRPQAPTPTSRQDQAQELGFCFYRWHRGGSTDRRERGARAKNRCSCNHD